MREHNFIRPRAVVPLSMILFVLYGNFEAHATPRRQQRRRRDCVQS